MLSKIPPSRILSVATKKINDTYFKMRKELRPSNPVEIRSFMDKFYENKRFETKIVDSFEEKLSNNKLVRIYKSPNNISKKCLFYVHGGGFVFGNLSLCHQLLSDLCHFTNVDIVSVDYRKTPEHCYPDAHEDVLTSVIEIQNRFTEKYNSYFLMGSSAGAMLSLHTAMNSKIKKLDGVILDSPAVDLNMNYESFKEFNEGYFLDSKSVKMFASMYFKGKTHDIDESKMADIKNWLLISSGIDPLRDQAFDLEQKLKLLKCNVNHHHFKDQLHAFHNLFYSHDIGMEKLPHLEIINGFVNREK